MNTADDARTISERALVGAAMSSTDLALAVVEQIQPTELRMPPNQIVLRVVHELVGKGEAVSPSVILAELGKRGELGRVGSGAYLHTLLDQAALPSQIGYHVRHVKAQVFDAELGMLGTRCAQLAEDAALGRDDKLELVQGWMDALSVGVTAENGTVQASELVYEVVDELERGADEDVLKTGFLDLDAAVSIRPGQVVVVGARPGSGKTTFGMDVARHVGIRRREPVYFLSLEMSARELLKRMIAAEGKVLLSSILHHRQDDPRLSEVDWDQIRRATDRITESRITIDDTPGAGLAHVKARLRHMQRNGGVRVAVIDYLGIMTSAGRSENRQTAVADLSRGLKLIARELNVPLIVLAQLNRGVEGTDRKPVPSDLRESGAVENDADVVLLLHRPDLHDREDPRAGEIDMIIGKNRHGPTCLTTAAFQGHYSRIVDMAEPPDDEKPPADLGHLRRVK